MSASHVDRGQFPAIPAGEPRIIRVTPELRDEAVERLVADRSRGESPRARRAGARRFVAYAAANRIRLDTMWALIGPDGTVLATVLGVPGPGRTAMVFASPAAIPREVPAVSGLVAHATRALAAEGVELAQALLDPGDARQRDVFAGGGYRLLARLSYLERPVPGPGRAPEPAWPDGMTTAPYDDAQCDDLLAVLDASYEATLDCPDLRGIRRTADILDGHRGTGRFDPALWTILRDRGRPAGACLLNPSPASDTVELVYIGLAREHRGRGLGRELLRHGLRLVAGRSERAVTLAVDDRNEPAIALYRGESFRRVLRRVALIRTVPSLRTDAKTP